MAIHENPLCMLAIKRNHNNFIPIDINSLGILKTKEIYTLKEIDEFIFNLGEEKIKELIRINNLVDDTLLDCNLVILLPGEKRYLPIIDKTTKDDYDLKQIIDNYSDDKEFTNQVINSIRNIKCDDTIKYNLTTLFVAGYTEVIWAFYNHLPYLLQRDLYLKIIKIVMRLEEKNIKSRNKKEK